MLRILPLLFILLLIDIPIWWIHIKPLHWAWQLLFFIPLIIASALMMLMQSDLYQAWMFRIGAMVILAFFIPKLFVMIFSVAGLAWRPLNYVGFVMGAAAFLMVAYGTTWGYKRLTLNNQHLTFSNLPKGFDGYKIVHLSDLHLGTLAESPDFIEKIVAKVNAQNPDLIVFTGDIVNSSSEEIAPFMDILSRLKAKDGIYSIMGNHDYCMYRQYDKPQDRFSVIKDLQNKEKLMGWQLLNNANVVLHHNGDSIAVVGVENSSRPPFPDYGDLSKAQGGLSDGMFKILLSHDPTHWRREVLPKSNIALQLSGHTHATQFRLFGWSPASWVYDEWGGLYSDGDRKLFVCTGTGGNLPFRIGAWPEIVTITLHSQP